jgi:hypothetical protein
MSKEDKKIVWALGFWASVFVTMCLWASLSFIADGHEGERGQIGLLNQRLTKLEAALAGLEGRYRWIRSSFPYETQIKGAGKIYCRCVFTEDEMGNPIEEEE